MVVVGNIVGVVVGRVEGVGRVGQGLVDNIVAGAGLDNVVVGVGLGSAVGDIDVRIVVGPLHNRAVVDMVVADIVVVVGLVVQL